MTVHVLACGCGAQRCARLFRQRDTVRDHVEPDDAYPGGHQEPDHQLADQAEADDARGFAQLSLSAPYAVHGDRPDGGEGGMLGLRRRRGPAHIG